MAADKSKVSIILSIYNVEKYIDECMSSLLSQTLSEYEIIMVDDGSPDKCPQICDEYQKKDSRIIVIHKDNEGLGMARNSGLKLASGEYVCFLDPDDFFDKDMLLDMYSTAVKNQLDAVYCSFRRVDIEGNLIKEALEVDTYTEIIGKENNIKHCLSMIGSVGKREKIFSMSACKVLFNRQFLIDNNLCFESERQFISEDMIFDIDFYLRSTRVGVIPKAYYNYRANPLSLSNKNKTNHSYNRFKIQYQEILRRLKAGGINDIHSLSVAHRYLIGSVNSVVYNAIVMKCSTNEVNQVINEIAEDRDFWKTTFESFPINNVERLRRILLMSTLKKRIWIWRLFVTISKFKNKMYK